MSPAPPPSAPVGPRDDQGRPHGSWGLSCAAVAAGTCRAEYVHGQQQTWEITRGTRRTVYRRAADGPWSRITWIDGVVHSELGVPPLPDTLRWRPGHEVSVPADWDASGWNAACEGPWRRFGPDGALEARGRCAGGRLALAETLDAAGRVVERVTRAADGDTGDTIERFDAAGQLRERVREQDGVAREEQHWYPDGTPAYHLVREGTFVVLERRWYADGRPASSNVWDADAGTRQERAWAPGGQLVLEGLAVAHRRVGPWRTWYPDGRRRSLVRYGRDVDVQRCRRRVERRAARERARSPVLGAMDAPGREAELAACDALLGAPLGPARFWDRRGRVRMRITAGADGGSDVVLVDERGAETLVRGARAQVTSWTASLRDAAGHPLSVPPPACDGQRDLVRCARVLSRRAILSRVETCLGRLRWSDIVHAWRGTVTVRGRLSRTLAIEHVEAPGATGPVAACIAGLVTRAPEIAADALRLDVTMEALAVPTSPRAPVPPGTRKPCEPQDMDERCVRCRAGLGPCPPDP